MKCYERLLSPFFPFQPAKIRRNSTEAKIQRDVRVSRTYKNSFGSSRRAEQPLSSCGYHFLGSTVQPDSTYSALNPFALPRLLEPR